MKTMLFATALIMLALISAGVSKSEVFMKRDEALKTAFPDADDIQKAQVFLTEGQAREIESLSKTKLDSRLYVIYEGMKGAQSLGYAIIDTHGLRTHSETVMFVINTDGTLRYAEVLAFFEPPDYIAGDKWMNLFNNKGLESHKLRVGKDIPNMSGATITAVALSDSVRRILGVFKVANQEGLLFSEAGK